MKVNTDKLKALVMEDLPELPSCMAEAELVVGMYHSMGQEIHGSEIVPALNCKLRDGTLVMISPDTIQCDCLSGSIDELDQDEQFVQWVHQVQEIIGLKTATIINIGFGFSEVVMVYEQGHLYEYDESERL